RRLPAGGVGKVGERRIAGMVVHGPPEDIGGEVMLAAAAVQATQVDPWLQEVGIGSDRSLVRLDGRRQAETRARPAEIVPGLRVPGLERDGLFEASGRLGVATLLLAHVAEAIPGIGGAGRVHRERMLVGRTGLVPV